jgi:hypothetical protein
MKISATVGGGNFTGIDGAFHKALPFGQVFAGEEHFAVRSLEQWANAEPLSGTVDGVGTMYPWVVLPGLIDRGDQRFGRIARNGTQIANQLRLTLRLRLGGEHVGLIAHRVGTENAARAGLPLGGVEILMRGLVADQGKVFRRPEAVIE